MEHMIQVAIEARNMGLPLANTTDPLAPKTQLDNTATSCMAQLLHFLFVLRGLWVVLRHGLGA
jgi:hypothetical protein